MSQIRSLDELVDLLAHKPEPPPAWAKPGIRTPDIQNACGICSDCGSNDGDTAHAHLCGLPDHLTPADAWYCDACRIHWVCDDCMVPHDEEERS